MTKSFLFFLSHVNLLWCFRLNMSLCSAASRHHQWILGNIVVTKQADS